MTEGHKEMPNMPHRIRTCFFLVASLLPLLGAIADDQCASRSADWTCFSAIEIQLNSTGPKYRMLLFPNQEMLAEINHAGITKRYLELPSGTQLYSGLSPDESIDSGSKNPFSLLELGFYLPLTALRTAFPLGPSSVPEGDWRKDIVIQGKAMAITTTRQGDQQVVYRLDSDAVHATGLWARSVQNPLPGDYALVGWISPSTTSFATVEQARSVLVSH